MFGKEKPQTKKKPARRKKKATRRKKHSASLSWAERSFGYRYKRAFWLGGLAITLLIGLLFNHFFVVPYRNRWRAIFGDPELPANYTIHGLDVSHHQGTVDWEKVASATIGGKARVEFVFIKATEGKSHLDRKFLRNFRKAGEYGLIRGAYHYFSPDVSGDRQARYFMDNVQLEEGDLPPVLDIEELGNLAPETLRKEALEWLHLMERRFGTLPIIYTGLKFKQRYLSTPEFDRYPFWIAHYYVKKVGYSGQWKFWQHTDVGVIDGINGKVDMNVYNGSMYDLRKLTIGHEQDSDEPQQPKASQKPLSPKAHSAAKSKSLQPKSPPARSTPNTPKQNKLSTKRTKGEKRTKEMPHPKRQ